MRELMDTVEELSSHPQLIRAAQDIAIIDRDTFKQHSNCGFVFHRRRLLDLGNWRYALLYQMIARIAEFKEPQMHSLITAISARYATLERKAVCTLHSLEMKADVIEYTLYLGRDIGAAVDAQIAASRNRFNALVVNFSTAADNLLMYTFHGDAAPKDREMLIPDMMAKVFFAYYGWVCTYGTQLEADKLAAFETMIRGPHSS